MCPTQSRTHDTAEPARSVFTYQCYDITMYVRASLTLSSRSASDSLQTISSDDPIRQGQTSRYPITRKTIESALWAILALNLL